MRTLNAPLSEREPSVELLVDRERRLLTRELLVELLAQRAPGPEEQSLERRDADAEHLGDLGVRATLELAHDHRSTLIGRQL